MTSPRTGKGLGIAARVVAVNATTLAIAARRSGLEARCR
jgi:hypothetical protein